MDDLDQLDLEDQLAQLQDVQNTNTLAGEAPAVLPIDLHPAAAQAINEVLAPKKPVDSPIADLIAQSAADKARKSAALKEDLMNKLQARKANLPDFSPLAAQLDQLYGGKNAQIAENQAVRDSDKPPVLLIIQCLEVVEEKIHVRAYVL